MQVSDDTEFDPDIVVVRLDEVGGAKFRTPPLLAVEIRSPGTAKSSIRTLTGLG